MASPLVNPRGPLASKTPPSGSNVAGVDTLPAANAGRPPTKDMANPKSNAANTGAQMRNPINPPATEASPAPPASSANTKGPVAKVRDESMNPFQAISSVHIDFVQDLIKELNDYIRHDTARLPEFLKKNPHLDLNFAPHSSELPLHLACFGKEPEQTLERLLAAGANPESFCRQGRNAIQCIASTLELSESVLDVLTRRYKNEARSNYINSVDQQKDWRATHYLADALMSHVDDDLPGLGALEDADWSLKDQYGDTPFEIAAGYGAVAVTSMLALKQWGAELKDINKDVLDNLDCEWTDAESQNTVYIQALIRRSAAPKSALDYEFLSSVRDHVTTQFRSERDPEDPVGGNGRESVCFFTRSMSQEDDITSLSIPYFSFDTIARIEGRKTKFQKLVKGFKYCSTTNFNLLGLQCASTLDEYCHPSLDNGTLADRNVQQALSRYQNDRNREERKVLTVPQLWIWTIGKKIFTAMPTSMSNEFRHFSLELITMFMDTRDSIPSAFGNAESPAPRPNLFADLLVGRMITECVKNLNVQLRIDQSKSVFDVFDVSIYQLSAKVRKYTSLEALSQNSIVREKDFILEVSEIREELSMIQSVLLEQEQVWRQFTQEKFPEFWPDPPGDRLVIPGRFRENKDYARALKVAQMLEEPQTQFAKYKGQIAKLDADAERVANSISLQLDLKARHASLKEAHLATLMSSAVIGFTIITIIFTPLAFLVSLFALSINQFQEHQTNSTLANAAPFYDSGYVVKWLATIECASLFVTGFAVWLALKLTTGFSVRETGRQLLGPWWKKHDAQHTSDGSAATNAAKEREKQAAVQFVAARDAERQASVSDTSKVAVTVPQTSVDGKRSVRKRFRIWPTGRRQEHVESGKEPVI